MTFDQQEALAELVRYVEDNAYWDYDEQTGYGNFDLIGRVRPQEFAEKVRSLADVIDAPLV